MKMPSLIATLLLIFLNDVKGQPSTDTLSDEKINHLIDQHSYLNGAKIPSDIGLKLGASHVAGKYYFTKKPYLQEGCEAVFGFGMKVIKIWFQGNPQSYYSYNSNWDRDNYEDELHMVQTPYYKHVLDMPFKTIILSVGAQSPFDKNWRHSKIDLSAEKNAVYRLAKYLLETYHDRDVIFIIENWEGDWLLRGGTGREAQWTPQLYPNDVANRCSQMIKWFSVRQEAVDSARREVHDAVCKVYHAIEVNKVLDCKKGIPGLTSDVLPFVKTDLVSWSCYDGMESSINLWHGIQYLKEKIKPTGFFPGTPVMIGEIGIPENEGSVFGFRSEAGTINRKDLIKRWDEALAVFEANTIPYVVIWEIYCNELKKKSDNLYDTNISHRDDELRGFWLIKPNGKYGYLGTYLKALLKSKGHRLNCTLLSH